MGAPHFRHGAHEQAILSNANSCSCHASCKIKDINEDQRWRKELCCHHRPDQEAQANHSHGKCKSDFITDLVNNPSNQREC